MFWILRVAWAREYCNNPNIATLCLGNGTKPRARGLRLLTTSVTAELTRVVERVVTLVEREGKVAQKSIQMCLKVEREHREAPASTVHTTRDPERAPGKHRKAQRHIYNN